MCQKRRYNAANSMPAGVVIAAPQAYGCRARCINCGRRNGHKRYCQTRYAFPVQQNMVNSVPAVMTINGRSFEPNYSTTPDLRRSNSNASFGSNENAGSRGQSMLKQTEQKPQQRQAEAKGTTHTHGIDDSTTDAPPSYRAVMEDSARTPIEAEKRAELDEPTGVHPSQQRSFDAPSSSHVGIQGDSQGSMVPYIDNRQQVTNYECYYPRRRRGHGPVGLIFVGAKWAYKSVQEQRQKHQAEKQAQTQTVY